MERTLVSDLPSYIGGLVKVQGWVDVVRNQRKMQFIVIRDYTGQVQLVHERGTFEQVEAAFEQLTIGSTLTIVGRVIDAPSVKLGGIEIAVEQVTVHSTADALPIDAETAFEKAMDYRWIDLRTPANRLIFQVWTTMESAMSEFLRQRGFIMIHTPKLTGAATENSGAELFKLDYFGRPATLAQSPQFYKQMAQAAGMEKIFEIGPIFRANESMTSRHDTEFVGFDVEFSWIDSHHDLMDLEMEWLIYVMRAIKAAHGEEIERVFGVEVIVPTTPFPRLTLRDASDIVERMGYRVPPETKGDLDPQAERLVSQYVRKNWGHDFAFITDYPASVRAFYHMRHDADQRLTKSYDLLYKGLEVTTGAQREHRIDRLTTQALEKGINPNGDIKFYFDFFRYGVPPHGGFGFGLSRFLMKILGLENVRQVTFLYRGPNRLTP